MGELGGSATVVVGAGLAGLAAATLWRERGERVVVVERANTAGGMARSIAVDGFTFDIGPHFVFSRTQWIRRFFPPEDLVQFTSEIFMVIGDSWIRYPFRPRSLLQVPFRVQWDFARTRLFGDDDSRPDVPTNSFHRLMSSIYGHEMYEYFFRPYLTKKLGGNDLSDKLHADWWSMAEHTRGVVSHPPPASSPHDARASIHLLRRIAHLRQRITHVFGTHRLLYPRHGFGEIASRMERNLRENGVEIRLGCGVETVHHNGGNIESVKACGDTIPVRRLIWTGSPVLLARALGVEPLDLPTLHLVVFFVTMDKRYPRRGTEVRPLAPEAAFYRAYYPEVISSALTPDGRSGLVAEMGTADIGDLENPEERYEAVADTIVNLGLCPRSGITGISHVTQSHCYPLYPLDYEQHLQRFYAGLIPFRNLILAGRNARFQYINSHQALRDGERTVGDELF